MSCCVAASLSSLSFLRLHQHDPHSYIRRYTIPSLSHRVLYLSSAASQQSFELMSGLSTCARSGYCMLHWNPMASCGIILSLVKEQRFSVRYFASTESHGRLPSGSTLFAAAAVAVEVTHYVLVLNRVIAPAGNAQHPLSKKGAKLLSVATRHR